MGGEMNKVIQKFLEENGSTEDAERVAKCLSHYGKALVKTAEGETLRINADLDILSRTAPEGPEEFYTVEDVKRANQRAGYHFFSPDTLRFFNSRILHTLYRGPGGYFFVTSERYDMSSPRLYTVRRFFPETGRIGTVGEFQEHGTARAARKVAEELAKG